ncbi:hypothetical protein SKAU_G00076410 [Synaphobranchus kaupii]|uniref:Uncharacterized protein n=1 Tax=Synaphobranchus kaupii TaxID=118154 RepID=A0A9Q1G8N7_SYNKA|nr:hypothetical protein SKAU_G00076410 [Synaphobranchus kaupii]
MIHVASALDPHFKALHVPSEVDYEVTESATVGSGGVQCELCKDLTAKEVSMSQRATPTPIAPSNGMTSLLPQQRSRDSCALAHLLGNSIMHQ